MIMGWLFGGVSVKIYIYMLNVSGYSGYDYGVWAG